MIIRLTQDDHKMTTMWP